MVVFAFQYLALNGLAWVGAVGRWALAGGRKPLSVIQKDLYFNASLPAYTIIILAFLLEYRPQLEAICQNIVR